MPVPAQGKGKPHCHDQHRLCEIGKSDKDIKAKAYPCENIPARALKRGIHGKKQENTRQSEQQIGKRIIQNHGRTPAQRFCEKLSQKQHPAGKNPAAAKIHSQRGE